MEKKIRCRWCHELIDVDDMKFKPDIKDNWYYRCPICGGIHTAEEVHDQLVKVNPEFFGLKEVLTKVQELGIGEHDTKIIINGEEHFVYLQVKKLPADFVIVDLTYFVKGGEKDVNT